MTIFMILGDCFFCVCLCFLNDLLFAAFCYLRVNEESLGFVWLVGQKKQLMMSLWSL